MIKNEEVFEKDEETFENEEPIFRHVDVEDEDGERYTIIFRNIATAQEMRMAAIPEHKEYVRAARNLSNLPDSWMVERTVRSTRNWKKKTRHRYQWEKNVVKENASGNVAKVVPKRVDLQGYDWDDFDTDDQWYQD